MLQQFEKIKSKIEPGLGFLKQIYSCPIYLVGGAVRDLLLGVESYDFDFGFEEPLDKLLSCNSSKDIVENVSEKHLTAKIIIASQQYDVVQFRKEKYSAPGSQPEVLPGTIEEDILRRDFSVNALFLKLDNSLELVDLVHGVRDLELKQLRVLHEKSFFDDPVRIIRGIRFCKRFEFTWEEETKRLAQTSIQNRDLLFVSPRRRYEEFRKILFEQKWKEILTSLIEEKLLVQLLPIPIKEDTLLKIEDSEKVLEYLLKSLTPEIRKEYFLSIGLSKKERVLYE